MTHVLPQQIARLVRMGLVALALIGAAEGAFAQSPVWQEAHHLYTELQDYEAALVKFTEDLKKKSNVEATLWIGNCYRMLGNRTKAMGWYNKTLKFKNYDPVVHLYIAELLMQANDFKKAKTRLLEYQKSPYANPLTVQRLLASCDSGMVLTAKPAPGKLRSEKARSDLPTDTATQQSTTSSSAPAPKEEAGAEFSLCIEAVDRNGKPLSNASIRLVNKTANKYAFLTTDALGTAMANLTVGSEYALTVSKKGYIAASIGFVMPNTSKRVAACLTLEPLKGKARKAKRKQQAAAAQKPVAAAPAAIAPRQSQPAPTKQVQSQPQQPQQQKTSSQQPQAKKEASSAQPFESFEITEVTKERKSLRLFRR